MRYERYIAIMALAFVIVASAGCTSSKPSQPAMDAANATADRMLGAINSGSYADFTRNFSSVMKAGVNESRFNDIESNMTGAYGKYISRAPVPATTSIQGYNIFIYDCRFEKKNVTIQIGMNPTDVWTVEGFYYRSP